MYLQKRPARSAAMLAALAANFGALARPGSPTADTSPANQPLGQNRSLLPELASSLSSRGKPGPILMPDVSCSMGIGWQLPALPATILVQPPTGQATAVADLPKLLEKVLLERPLEPMSIRRR